MSAVPVDSLSQTFERLWRRPFYLRNICILAHVDHGKTTLSDHLLASNGFISPKLAGKVRWLDNRPDEQERGITMKASSVALIFKDQRNYQNKLINDNPSHAKEADKKDSAHTDTASAAASSSSSTSVSSSSSQTSSAPPTTASSSASSIYMINLIDSPGHIDFSSEVSNAVRVSDGALVLVDVVEGVCSQSAAVLEQCYAEGLTPILVLTKVDRLITELKLSAMDAYLTMRRVIEKMNALAGTFVTREAMAESSSASASVDYQVEIDDSKQFVFSPEQGNVIFCSAVDGWAFTVPYFASLFSKKLGMNARSLVKALWGDFYYNGKTKTVSTKGGEKGGKPMFVSMILENIWQIYSAIAPEEDSSGQQQTAEQQEKIKQIITKLGLTVPPKELTVKDPRSKLAAILTRWLPLSSCVLGAVVDHLPSPIEAQQRRLSKLWPLAFDSTTLTPALLSAAQRCDAAYPDLVIYLAKMIDFGTVGQKLYEQHEAALQAANEKKTISDEKLKQQFDEEARFIAFGRIFCGTLRTDVEQTIYVYGPKYDNMAKGQNSDGGGSVLTPATSSSSSLSASANVIKISSSQLRPYLLMASDLHAVSVVPSGTVFGLGGLGGVVLKTATISSIAPPFPPFKAQHFQSSPIVRVAVYPAKALDMHRLVHGLRLLNLSDPNILVGVQESGEHVIQAAGELHLERCLRDLKERFAVGIEMRVSDPIVSFRETILSAAAPKQMKIVKKKKSEKKKKIKEKGGDSDEDVEKDKEDEEKESADEAKEKEREETGVFSDDPFLCEEKTPQQHCIVHMRAIPMPAAITKFLTDNESIIKALNHLQQRWRKIRMRNAKRQRTESEKSAGEKEEITSTTTDTEVKQTESEEQHNETNNDAESNSTESSAQSDDEDDVSTADVNSLRFSSKMDEFLQQLRKHFQSSEAQAVGLKSSDFDGIWSFGPKHVGANVLINRVANIQNSVSMIHFINSNKQITNSQSVIENSRITSADSSSDFAALLESIRSGLLSGFQLATSGGPLCEEPLVGVCFLLEHITLNSWLDDQNVYGSINGQVLSVVKSVCRKSLLTHAQRLVEPLYRVQLQCSTEALGSLHAVLSRRRGHVMSETLLEGTNSFLIDAFLPVCESFGFASEMRKKTGGLANPQLLFSHWEIVDIDPSFVPSTLQDLEEGNVENDNTPPNLARLLIDNVRRRKGLAVKEKVVQHAEKQRTLARKK